MGMIVRRKIKFNFLGIMILAGLLTGCGVTYPDMTEEEQAHVVEYATGLLLKYDKYHEYSLVQLEESEAEKPTPTAVSKNTEGLPDAGEEMTGDFSEQPDVVDMTEPQTLTEIIGIDGIDFQYVGCEVADTYPDDTLSEEVYPYVDASKNNKLLILKFDATNISGSELQLDMNERNVRFKIGWNGGAPQNALVTFLLNDMAAYKGEIPAGQTVQLVSLAEVPEESAMAISNVEFLIKDSEGINSANFEK